VATRKSLRRMGGAAEGTADREMLRRTPAEVLEQARLTTARMDDELAKAIRRRRETLPLVDEEAKEIVITI